MIQECPESISVLCLLLLLAIPHTSKKGAKVYSDISQLSLTLLLVMSFYIPPFSGSNDEITFSGCMTEKQNFDIFQYSFLRNCTSSQSAEFLSDYIIIFQKLTQQEPQGVIASLNPKVLKFMKEVVANSSGQDMFVVSNIKSILKNIDA